MRPVEGFVFSSIFGFVFGLACVPFSLVLLWNRDWTRARPYLLWATLSFVAVLAAWNGSSGLLMFVDMSVSAAAFVVGCGFVAVFSPRRQGTPGLCRSCGNDIRASVDFGRCPECGSALLADATIGPVEPELAGGRLSKLRHHALRYAFVVSFIVIGIPSGWLIVDDLTREILGSKIYRRAAATKGDETFCLADVATFDWDRVYVFGPYGGGPAIQRSLGFTWSDAHRAGQLNMNENRCLLVFCQGSRVVQWVIPVGSPLLSADGWPNRMLLRHEAVFKCSDVCVPTALESPAP